MIRKSLFAVTLLMTLIASSAYAGNHNFDISGNAVAVLDYGTEVGVIVDTDVGPGVDTYTILCSNAEFCRSIVFALQAGGVVTIGLFGVIVKQVAGDGFTQTIRFRATYVEYCRPVSIGMVCVASP